MRERLSIEASLVYFASCQLATVYDLHLRKRFPKGEMERHKRIAEGMVQDCMRFVNQEFIGRLPASDRVVKAIGKIKAGESIWKGFLEGEE